VGRTWQVEWTAAAYDDPFPYISQETNYKMKLGGTSYRNLPVISKRRKEEMSKDRIWKRGTMTTASDVVRVGHDWWDTLG
jgi:hypothetical protein